MKNINKEYLALLENDKESFQQFYRTQDIELASSLIAQGWGKNQIAAVMRQHSFFLQNNPKTPATYLQSLCEKATPGEKEGDVQQAYAKQQPELIRSAMKFYMQKDIIFSSALARKEWRDIEIQEVLLKHSPAFQRIKDENKQENDFCKMYVDHVLSNTELVNTAFAKTYELAVKDYKKLSQAMRQKFNNTYKTYQDGKVVADMMVNRGYPEKIMQEVVAKHTLYEGAFHPNYEKGIVEKCRSVKAAYMNIAAADPRYAQNVEDVYRVYAKEYLDRTRMTLLNGKDDQKIVARMLKQGLSEKDVQEALLKASPVSHEPGREKEEYVSSILTLVKDAYQKKVAFAQKKLPEVLKMYEEEAKKIAAELEQKSKRYNSSIDKNRAYYDGIIAKRMLDAKHSVNNVMQAIAKESPLAVQKSETSPQKTPEGYAKFIVYGVQKQIKAEQELLSFKPSVPSEQIAKMNLEAIRAAGISVGDLYKWAVKERIEQYPNTAERLSQHYIDKDAADKLLHKFGKEIVPGLKEAIHLHSPRAQMPGIPSDYPHLVLEEMEIERRSIERKQQEQSKPLQSEYLRQCGLANEGVESSHNAYHDGRAAIKMLQDGMERAEICKVIAQEAPHVRGDSEKYAGQIVDSAEQVLLRAAAIREYQQQENQINQRAQDVVDVYMKRMQHEYELKKYVSSRMDISVAATLLAAGYEAKQIKETIAALSPVAVEPGRGAQYPDFVAERAAVQIETEKKELEKYAPIPRLNKDSDVGKEYETHLRYYGSRFHLPVTPQVDQKIMTAMLQQGYEQAKILQAVQQLSPCRSQEKNYGKALLRKSIQQAKGKEMDSSLEMSRSYWNTGSRS